jgi:Ca-activated chloride channel family protein
MTFGHPLLLLTLLVVPAVLVLWRLMERRRMRYAVRYTNVDVLATVARGREWRRFVPLALFLLAVAALCVAVARPHAKTLVLRDRATVILVIDTSRSMQASDIKPTRLAAAQQAVNTFLDKVPKRLRVGLIAFSGYPVVSAPPTTDHKLVRESLHDIGSIAGGGTAIGDALAAAVQLGIQSVNGNGSLADVRTSTPTHGLVSILFLSDGAQTRGDLQPLDGAERAKQAGIPVYTVALGTPNGRLKIDFPYSFNGGSNTFTRSVPVPPDPDTLRQIAETSGGKFFAARSNGAVNSAYASLGSKLGRRPARTEITYGFVAAAAALLLAAGLLSVAWSPRIP